MNSNRSGTKSTASSAGGTLKKRSGLISSKGAPKHSLIRALTRQRDQSKNNKAKPKPGAKTKNKTTGKTSATESRGTKENIGSAGKNVWVDEIPERDINRGQVLREVFNNEDVRSLISEQYKGADTNTVAYNKRLSSSTPINIPLTEDHSSTFSSLQSVHDAQPHAMNSAEYLPRPPPANPGPRLLDGRVNFAHNPHLQNFQSCGSCNGLIPQNAAAFSYSAPEKLVSFTPDELARAAQVEARRINAEYAQLVADQDKHRIDTMHRDRKTQATYMARGSNINPPPVSNSGPSPRMSSTLEDGFKSDGYTSANRGNHGDLPASARNTNTNNVAAETVRTDPRQQNNSNTHNNNSPRQPNQTEGPLGGFYRPITPMKMRSAWTESNGAPPTKFNGGGPSQENPLRVSFYSSEATQTTAPSQKSLQFVACTQTDGGRKVHATKDEATGPVEDDEEDLSEESDEVTAVEHPTSLTNTVQTHLQKIRQLCREVKRDRNASEKVKKLSLAMEERCSALEPAAWQIEWDMALQPLRKENAQLRRRVRILTQQLKDRAAELDSLDSPPGWSDINLELVKQQLISTKLESRLKEELESGDRLRNKLANAQHEIGVLKNEKQTVVRLIANKQNTEHRQEVEERRLDRAEQEELQKEIKILQTDKQKLNIELQAKDKEIDNMKQLVSGLQQSMTSLLQSLSRPSMSPQEASRTLSNMMEDMHQQQPIVHRPPQVPEPAPYAQLTKANVMTLPREQPLRAPDFRAPDVREEQQEEDTLSSFNTAEETEEGESTLEALDKGAVDYYRDPKPKADDVKFKTTPTSAGETEEATEYLLPAGMSPMVKHTQKDNKDSPRSTTTVKELLTPIAEQMNKLHAKIQSTAANRGQSAGANQGQSTGVSRALTFDQEEDGGARGGGRGEVPNVARALFSSQKDADGNIMRQQRERERTVEENLKHQQRERPIEERRADNKAPIQTQERPRRTDPVETSFATSANQSRYSVSDYFNKYRKPSTEGTSSQTTEIGLRKLTPMKPMSAATVSASVSASSSKTSSSGGSGSSSLNGLMNAGQLSAQLKGGAAGPPRRISQQQRDSPQTSGDQTSVWGRTPTQQPSQEDIFVGTELDTSISSIGTEAVTATPTETETALTRDDGMTTTYAGGSVTSVDNRAFEQGLAKLDAEIANLQRKLEEDTNSLHSKQSKE